MKRFVKPLLLFSTLFPVGCGQATTRDSSTDVDSSNESSTDPSSQDAISESAKQKALAAKQVLFQTLSERLLEVMTTDGPAQAIAVCSQKARQIADTVSRNQGVTIGRTSLKLRNPENAVPKWAQDLVSETAIEPQFVRIDSKTVGAFLPIRLQAKCLLCHGDIRTIPDVVQDELNRRYPNDRAIGFKDGDLRGWFWVEVLDDRTPSASVQ